VRLLLHAALAALPKALDFGMHNAHVPGQRIRAREGLFLTAHRAPNLLLAPIMDGVLVSREIVRTREDSVAGLVRRRVDARALVWARLGIASQEFRGCHPACRRPGRLGGPR